MPAVDVTRILVTQRGHLVPCQCVGKVSSSESSPTARGEIRFSQSTSPFCCVSSPLSSLCRFRLHNRLSFLRTVYIYTSTNALGTATDYCYFRWKPRLVKFLRTCWHSHPRICENHRKHFGYESNTAEVPLRASIAFRLFSLRAWGHMLP
jgi:hypothetical protein